MAIRIEYSPRKDRATVKGNKPRFNAYERKIFSGKAEPPFKVRIKLANGTVIEKVVPLTEAGYPKDKDLATWLKKTKKLNSRTG